MNIATIRREYTKTSLSKKEVNADPFVQFHLWLNQALDAKVEDALAMSLSTVGTSGFPSSRMVLLKESDNKGFIFFTNFNSRKGKEMLANNRVALLFYWKELERQVRVTGTVKKISRKESAAYFASRPIESQVSAVISPQSEPIPSRKWLESKWEEANLIYSNEKSSMPETWGGFRVTPVEFEFFQGREFRLHDRIQYRIEKGAWVVATLAP